MTSFIVLGELSYRGLGVGVNVGLGVEVDCGVALGNGVFVEDGVFVNEIWVCSIATATSVCNVVSDTSCNVEHATKRTMAQKNNLVADFIIFSICMPRDSPRFLHLYQFHP